MLKVNTKDYQAFSHQERFNLTIAAIARDDVEEIQILQRTCPKKHYYLPDLNYDSRLQAIMIVSFYFSDQIIFYYNKINMVTIFSALAEYPSHTQNKFLLSESKLEKLHQSFLNHIVSLKSVFNGFIDFCGEIGIKHEDIFTIIKIRGKCEQIDEYLSAEIEENEHLRQKIKNEFLEWWRAYV